MQASNDQNKEYVTPIVYKYRYIYTYMLPTYLFIECYIAYVHGLAACKTVAAPS